MATLQIKIDLSHVLGQMPAIIDGMVLPNLSQAVYAVADKVALRWKEAVMKAPGVWIAEKQAYVASITWKDTGPFSAEVWSDYQYAQDIESGRPSRDLKAMLQTSNKTRLNKLGKRYLIIPFRHNVPGSTAHALAMPPDVHMAVSTPAFAKSKVLGTTTRLSATGATVPQNIYQWGHKLAWSGPKKAAHHSVNIYTGMVRFNTSAGKQNSSGYVTFRTMTEGSSKWILPAKPGLYILKAVTETMLPKAEAAFEKAMELDTATA